MDTTQKLLDTRKAMFYARDLFRQFPEWDNSDESANWRMYHETHYIYCMRRREFLEHRRYIRAMARLRATEAALATANDEVTRLRAALNSDVV